MFALLWCAIGYADVEYVNVRAIGDGPSKAEAIKSAQIQAIGQVSGELIKSNQTILKASQQSQGEVVSRVKLTTSEVEDLVKGGIRETRVIRVDLNDSGLYEAEIEAVVIKVNQSEQLKRRRIVLVVSDADKSSRLAENVRSSIEGALVESQKMAVLDRKESGPIEREVALMLSSRAGIEDRLKAASLPSTDLIGAISITRLEQRKDGFGAPFVAIAATARVIDASSRQVKYSRKTEILYPGNLSDAAFAASKRLGERIAQSILDFAYPMLVISETSGFVTVSAGAGQLKVGQAVKIYLLGADLTDPLTGEVIGKEETEAGSGIVTETSSALSKVKAAAFSLREGRSYLVRTDGGASVNGGSTNKVSDKDW